MFKVFAELIENVSEACRKSKRTFQLGFRQGAMRAYAEAQKIELIKATPRSDKPGEHAGDAWEIDYEYTGMFISGFEVTNKHDRIDYLEYGTSAHMIFPKRAKALRFEMDGDIVFARYVVHPGIDEMGFVRKVQDKMNRELPSWVSKTFDAPIEKHWK